MDKETLSNYGWIVICTLVLAVMIALAGPFGTFVSNAVKSTTQGLFDVNQNALGAAGITIDDNAFPACDHTYEKCICTQCGNIMEHACNFENNKCTFCDKELPVIGKAFRDYTWEEIKIISELGMGDDYFNCGDTKSFTLSNGAEIMMEIVAFDADTKSDGTGMAGITLMSKYAITKHSMNSTNTNAGGWAESEMRSWLQQDLWTLVPTDVKKVIVNVDKTYMDCTSGTVLTCEDNIWIPSIHEVYPYSEPYCGEQIGAQYHNYLTEPKLIKYDMDGNEIQWWLRTTYAGSYRDSFYSLRRFDNYGGTDLEPASNMYGVVIGFCI